MNTGIMHEYVTDGVSGILAKNHHETMAMPKLHTSATLAPKHARSRLSADLVRFPIQDQPERVLSGRSVDSGWSNQTRPFTESLPSESLDAMNPTV